jgi:hypothetical protein
MHFEQCKRVQAVMAAFQFPWFIAGGWALDLYIGRETREHDDIENCHLPTRSISSERLFG